MSQCSKELDLVFDQIGKKAVQKKDLEEDSEEWKKLNKEIDSLYKHATSIFMHYNPGFDFVGEAHVGRKKKKREYEQ